MERSRTSFNYDQTDVPADGAVKKDPFCPAEINALAFRVLFSDDLNEKLSLRAPSTSSDTLKSVVRNGKIGDFTGVVPTRPENLLFARDSKARPSLPGRPGLVSDENRGILLHFFANHELLAAELMALALLKFQDAPHAFREGLARTLREEQLHTRWYVNRMQECGVVFGQYPVSPFFWDAVSPMECPLDYVSRLSLTFEQANLDYSLHFGNILAEAGDSRSAAILHRIYRDEISHVGYGLQWFRQWKNKEDSDWTALERRLPFPLSPNRAKGNRTTFNAEGRRAAGFDENYIRQLSLFERSKGRTPNVFYFNPDAEQRIAAWPRPYHPDKKRRSVINDLELLAAFLARRDDVLLMRRPPSDDHLERLKNFGFVLPEIEPLAPAGCLDLRGLLLQRKINSLRPWSIAPDLPEFFERLQPAATGPATRKWSREYSTLFSKIEQARSLSQWFGISHHCESSSDLRRTIADLEGIGCKRAIIKRPFSTAGSGIIHLDIDQMGNVRASPMSERIRSEGGVLIEPAHNRIFDFSVQYEIEEGNPRIIGLVEQIISPHGRYLGSICQIKFCTDLDPCVAQFLSQTVFPFYAEDSPFSMDLAKWATERGYSGPLGIDAYLYRDDSGQLVHRPLCEVNPRYTMGRVALELRSRVAPGKGIKLQILKVGDVAESADDPVLDDQGRLSSGSIDLTEPIEGSCYRARVTVAKRFHRPSGQAQTLRPNSPDLR